MLIHSEPMNDQRDPVVRIRTGSDRKPNGAAATVRIDRPIADVWAAIADVETFGNFIPMVSRAKRSGDDVTFDLKFKIGFFSVGFQFSAHATYEEQRWLELRWTAGEPKDIRLRFEVSAVDDGRATLVTGDGEFDVMSLGWLAKYFLRHHPEIQFGIFPGVALVLVDALRRATDEPR
jgi:carbon monoxide dehydrogenase subunit G